MNGDCIEKLYPYIAAIGVYGKCSPSFVMNDSKTRRSPHKGTESHRKNKNLFQILPFLWCCSGWIHRQEGNREKASRKPQWKNYDFTMFLSRITASHGIAVDWYLRVYWLLPLSIVASFKKHRRFFHFSPTILLESSDDSFSEHREYFGKSVNFLNGICYVGFLMEVDYSLRSSSTSWNPVELMLNKWTPSPSGEGRGEAPGFWKCMSSFIPYYI